MLIWECMEALGWVNTMGGRDVGYVIGVRGGSEGWLRVDPEWM